MIQLSETARQEARQRWDHVAKPLHSLGHLESMITRIAAIQRTADIAIVPRCVLVFCGDHGVTCQGISQCGSDVTRRVALSIAQGTSNINLMAGSTNADVFCIDMGMSEPADDPRIILHRLGNGTADLSSGPAMSRRQAEEGIQAGIRLVNGMRERGYRLIATGEMGIGNTTSAAALSCAYLNLSPENAAGRGAGLSDAGLAHKKEIIRHALHVNAGSLNDPVDTLAALGGFEIAGMTGAFIGAAACGLPIIIDGVISAVSALAAMRIEPQVQSYLLASHLGREPVSTCLMDALHLSPVLHADLALGEGTGAVLLFPLLDAAYAVYTGQHTFDSLNMEAYRPLGGEL
ncbi:MAG: nicotinate-nucleotide--dimethylbenzimidazole phosphoribosyltransferase [Clostridia bacterium]|nr:nicotinate-nucleotide--dimethylbenzimidazole phosphoribosyltransferase [Clostridia bacterium]